MTHLEDRTPSTLNRPVIETRVSSPNPYLQTAKNPKEIGQELTVQCEDMLFMREVCL